MHVPRPSVHTLYAAPERNEYEIPGEFTKSALFATQDF